MLWLAALFFFALRKLAAKFKHKYLWWVPFVCLALGVASLAFAPLPFGWGSIAGLLALLTGWVLGWIGALFGVSAAVIAAVLLVIVIGFGLVDLLKDRTPDAWARTMVFATPVLALVAAGSLAANVLEFVQNLGNVGPTVVGSFAR